MSDRRVIVRAVQSGDLTAVRELLRQLGYELDPTEVRRRFEAVSAAPTHSMFIAERDGKPVALLHLFERPALEKPPEVVVQALVVDGRCRATGIGRQMMKFAEHWARERGLSSVSLASRIDRTDSHSFYTRLGYECIASSHIFRKDLTRPAPPP